MDSQQARMQWPFHRDNRELPSETTVLIRTLAALRLMGITDRYVICRILNVGEGEDHHYRVRQLDRLYNIYHMFTYGLPKGMFVDVKNTVTCPRCHCEISVIPCVKCSSEGAFKPTMEDYAPVWDD